MMILVVSDIHGSSSILEDIYHKEKPDKVIFLGDGMEDFLHVRDFEMGGTDTFVVCGNCDRDYFNEYLVNQTANICGISFYITHGFREGVKQGLDGIYAVASSNFCEVALYGHTHMQDETEIGGIKFINPGAVEDGKYCTIEINDKKMTVNLKGI